MSNRSLLSRVTGGAYLVLAFTLSGVLPAAEAREYASAPVSHVEAPTDRGCPAAHDHWSCNICRALRLMARGEQRPSLTVFASAPVAPPIERADTFILLRLGSAWRSRAPPAL
jgi:hypothetical protein